MAVISRDSVRSQILGILTSKDGMSLQLDVSSLNDNTALSRELALDSLQKLELCMALEDVYGRPFDTGLFDTGLDRLGRLIDHILGLSSEAGRPG
jgi:acyl carrier protein